jgi:hypothetical protein
MDHIQKIWITDIIVQEVCQEKKYAKRNWKIHQSTASKKELDQII